MNKIRKGDEVVILAGKDRGRRGAVLRRVDDEHVVVEGINRVKKHVRPNPMKGQVGGIVEKEMPINVSNVALFNPATQRPTASASRCLRMAARFASSSPMAKWLRLKDRQWPACKISTKETVVPQLLEQFGYKTVMEVPASPRSP